MQERLQKILSAAGVVSRRAAEGLIVQGRVAVNGTPVLDLGSKADPQTDTTSVDGSSTTPQLQRGIELPRKVLTQPTFPEDEFRKLDGGLSCLSLRWR